MVRGDRYSVQQVPEVVGESGNMLIHFYSDVAYNMTGFNITFRYVTKFVTKRTCDHVLRRSYINDLLTVQS